MLFNILVTFFTYRWSVAFATLIIIFCVQFQNNNKGVGDVKQNWIFWLVIVDFCFLVKFWYEQKKNVWRNFLLPCLLEFRSTVGAFNNRKSTTAFLLGNKKFDEKKFVVI